MKDKVVNIPDTMLADPSVVVKTKIQHQDYASVVEQLREDYRTVLFLRFINELTPEETSQVMGRSIGAVRVLQHRALSAFRKLVPQQGFEM